MPDVVVTEFEPTQMAAIVESHGRLRVLRQPAYAVAPASAYAAALIAESASAADATCAVAADDGAVAGLCVLRRPAWDEGLFGFPVGRIDYLLARDAAAATALASWAAETIDEWPARVSSARVAIEDTTAIGALEAAGYRFQEVTLNPWVELKGGAWGRDDSVREARAGDLEKLCDIARTAFRTDRFHCDTRFDPVAADAVYDTWVRTWFASPSADKHALVIESGGQPAGFVLYHVVDMSAYGRGDVVELVLGTVDPASQRRGLGLRLWSALLSEASRLGAFYSTTITALNTPMIELYLRLGCSVSVGDVTLHRWRT